MKTIHRLVLAAALALTFGVAHADVVVVVSAKSSASKLTKEQVADIFLGRATNMVPMDQAAGSPVRDEFYSKVTGQKSAVATHTRSDRLTALSPRPVTNTTGAGSRCTRGSLAISSSTSRARLMSLE